MRGANVDVDVTVLFLIDAVFRGTDELRQLSARSRERSSVLNSRTHDRCEELVVGLFIRSLSPNLLTILASYLPVVKLITSKAA